MRVEEGLCNSGAHVHIRETDRGPGSRGQTECCGTTHWRTLGGEEFGSTPPPPEITKFRKSWAKFPVPLHISNSLIRARVLFIYKLSETPN
jgi:hypothetical protein